MKLCSRIFDAHLCTFSLSFPSWISSSLTGLHLVVWPLPCSVEVVDDVTDSQWLSQTFRHQLLSFSLADMFHVCCSGHRRFLQVIQDILNSCICYAQCCNAFDCFALFFRFKNVYFSSIDSPLAFILIYPQIQVNPRLKLRVIYSQSHRTNLGKRNTQQLNVTFAHLKFGSSSLSLNVFRCKLHQIKAENLNLCLIVIF